MAVSFVAFAATPLPWPLADLGVKKLVSVACFFCDGRGVADMVSVCGRWPVVVSVVLPRRPCLRLIVPLSPQAVSVDVWKTRQARPGLAADALSGGPCAIT